MTRNSTADETSERYVYYLRRHRTQKGEEKQTVKQSLSSPG